MTGTETGRFAAMVELMPESVILRRRDGRILAWLRRAGGAGAAG